MTQKRDFHRISRRFGQRSLWVGGIGWLGSLGLLSTVALAVPAIASPTSDVQSIPSAQDLLAPAAAPDPAAAPELPVTPAESPVHESVAPAPAPIAGDADSVPQPEKASTLLAPDLSGKAAAAFGNNSYIDSSSSYSLGATQDPSLELSERSTGCQVLLQPGQAVPDSICPKYSAPVAAGSGSVPVGPLSLSVYGISTGAPPSGQDFYNLTVRPPALLGNGNVQLIFPLSIPAVITSAFGWRLHPILGESRFHSGTDLGAPLGTPVVAAFAGKVVVSDFMGGYGLAVVLQHDSGKEETQTLYGHMSEVFVKPGETVKQGDVIGRVGSTGLSTGPHLHFEVRKLTPDGWVVMDPGQVLETAVAQLTKSMQLAQLQPKLFQISWTSFSEALKIVETKKGLVQAKQPHGNLPPSDLDTVAVPQKTQKVSGL